MLEIEKGVPIPERNKGNYGKSAKYPFKAMEVGDSVFLANYKSSTIGGLIAYWKLATGFRFTVRTVEGGVRVWRVE